MELEVLWKFSVVGFKRFALFFVENCQEHTVIYRASCTSRSSIFENRLNTSVFFAFIKAKRVLVPSQATKKAKHRGISAPVQKLKRKRETNVIFCMLHFEIGRRVDTTERKSPKVTKTLWPCISPR